MGNNFLIMKAQLILLFLLASVVTTKSFATETKTEPKQTVKKTTQSKYDFNIFKMHAFVSHIEKTDSLNSDLKALPHRKKSNY